MAKKKISITIDEDSFRFIKSQTAKLKGGVSGFIDDACAAAISKLTKGNIK